MSDLFPEQPEGTENYLPSVDDPPDSGDDLELSDAALLSEFPESEDVPLEDPPPFPVGRSWAFDFARNAFVFGRATGEDHRGRGSPLRTFGAATMRTWVEKCLRTARGAHPIHPEGYGMVQPFDLIGGGVTGAPVADLKQRISDALTFHPRITGIADFRADINSDEETIFVSFTVLFDDETALSFVDARLV